MLNEFKHCITYYVKERANGVISAGWIATDAEINQKHLDAILTTDLILICEHSRNPQPTPLNKIHYFKCEELEEGDYFCYQVKLKDTKFEIPYLFSKGHDELKTKTAFSKHFKISSNKIESFKCEHIADYKSITRNHLKKLQQQYNYFIKLGKTGERDTGIIKDKVYIPYKG